MLNPVTYHERVLPNPFALSWVVLVFGAIYLTLLPFNEIAGVAVGITAAVAVLVSIWFAAPVIDVDREFLSVSDAQIPRKFIGKVEVIAKEQLFAERGVNLDPRAYIRFQATVKTLVKIEIVDSSDPTPYWLVASKRSAELLNALKTS